MVQKKTHEWLDILDSFVKNYNNSKNRGIGMKPVDVNEENKHQVWIKLFGQPVGEEIPSPKFKVGDVVRISKYKDMKQISQKKFLKSQKCFLVILPSINWKI